MKYKFNVLNLDCANCANKIEKKLNEHPDIEKAIVNFNNLTLTVYTKELDNPLSFLEAIIHEVEPEVKLTTKIDSNNPYQKQLKTNIIIFVSGLIFTFIGMFLTKGKLSEIFIVVSYLLLLSKVIIKAFKQLKNFTIDENILITISCLGAYLTNNIHEGLMVIILYDIGKILENIAVNNSRKSIKDLMNIKPEYANLLKENNRTKVNPELVKVGDTIKLMQTNKEYLVTEVGIRTPKEVKTNCLSAGEVGYLAAQIKDIKDVFPGETITLASNPALKPLPGYRKINPMVFCGLYPVDSKKYLDLKDALEKLTLNDASLVFEAETSQALGFGFRCGFLGLLHMDVIQERLEREYNIDLILTAPSVIYHVYLNNGTMIELDNPSKLPEITLIKEIQEPYVKAQIMTPKEYVGPVMDLCQKRRGIYVDLEYFDDTRMIIKYELPLSEIVYNFFDKLKSYSKGYASFDYEYSDYRAGNLVKMDILLNGECIDALSIIVNKADAYQRGSLVTRKLKDIIPRQQFEVPVQAAINGKVIARTDIKAVRKDVLAKCYGGDISRKKKLLEKQKEGKKRMKAVGSVEVPQEAFMSVLSIDDED